MVGERDDRGCGGSGAFEAIHRSGACFSSKVSRFDPHRVARPCGVEYREGRRSLLGSNSAGESGPVIELRRLTRILVAAGVTYLQRGFQGLTTLVETELEQAPFSGHIFIFRGKRGRRVKSL
jgi:IS66 Orf2 like protein